ncbi:MAG: hypothetical protein ACOC1U_06085 [Spirochaetota bacterium]
MQNNRSRVIWFVALALAFFFILDPFRLFESNNVPRMRVNSEIEQEMDAYLASSPPAPAYVVDLLESHDLVMIGETGYVSEQLEFLADLIPELDAGGYRHLGFQYANHADQDLVDELLTGSSFDEELADRILFSHMVILGYEEHRDVFRAAWQVNRGKAEDEEPFRIIALSRSPDYSAIEEQDDVEDPEVLSRVFADGVPDQIMAETIMDRIVDAGHKGVTYTQTEHAFTDFAQTQYEQTMSERGFPGQRRAGNLIAERLGDRVATVILHGPIQDTRSRIGYGYPLGGVLDAAYARLPQGAASVGFTVPGSPYADAPISSDVIGEGLDEELTFERFTDGYLLIGQLKNLTPVTPIPGFITEENVAEARLQFPGPAPGEVTVADMNDFISGTAQQMARIF